MDRSLFVVTSLMIVKNGYLGSNEHVTDAFQVSARSWKVAEILNAYIFPVAQLPRHFCRFIIQSLCSLDRMRLFPLNYSEDKQ